MYMDKLKKQIEGQDGVIPEMEEKMEELMKKDAEMNLIMGWERKKRKRFVAKTTRERRSGLVVEENPDNHREKDYEDFQRRRAKELGKPIDRLEKYSKLKNSKLKNKELEQKENNEKWAEKDEKRYNEAQEIIQTENTKIKKIEKRLMEIDKRLSELDDLEKLIKEGEKNKKEEKIYSTDFIKEKILPLLEKIKEIDEIKSFEIEGIGKEITLNTVVKSYGFNIKVQATFENKENKIVVKSYNIDAMWPAKGKAEKALVPQLDKISEMLKSYIEKETNQKIEKIWIEDGELKAL